MCGPCGMMGTVSVVSSHLVALFCLCLFVLNHLLGIFFFVYGFKHVTKVNVGETLKIHSDHLLIYFQSAPSDILIMIMPF